MIYINCYTIFFHLYAHYIIIVISKLNDFFFWLCLTSFLIIRSIFDQMIEKILYIIKYVD